MRAVLIYPNIGNIPSFNFGLGIIAAHLKQNGHVVDGLHINPENENELDISDIENKIMDFNPNIVMFSSVSNQYKFVKLIARHLKNKCTNSQILVGGIHASISPEEILKEDFIDMVCLGEGEDAVLELVSKLEKGEDILNIKNIWIKKDGKIIKNELRPLIKELGRLPFADRTLFGFKDILEKKRGWINIMAGRGCPFKCDYCVNHYLSKLNKGENMLRLRPIDHILAEIKEIEKRHKIKMVNFNDDTFTLNKEWTLKFCEQYSKTFKYNFACNVRATNFDEELAFALKKAGCAEIKIGLESGSKRVRENILNRHMSNEQIENAFNAAKKAGIRTWSYNMVGIPTETKDEILETIKLNAKIRPYILRCSILFPYKGTNIYKMCVEKGILDKSKEFKYASYFDGTTLRLEHLSEADVLRYKVMFKWYVDAYSNIEVAGFYKKLLSLFEELPDNMWLTGEAQKLFKEMDEKIDSLLKTLKLEHYSSRSHLHLNFSEHTSWELP